MAQRWTRPYRPQTNGKAERFIQTLLREWAYGRPYFSSFARQAALPTWLHYYNWHRPHGGIHRRPPISRVVPADNLVKPYPSAPYHRGRGRRPAEHGLREEMARGV